VVASIETWIRTVAIPFWRGKELYLTRV
jgi:hypothetical protein